MSFRDVKPENVILDEEGHAHLTDFNIATILEEGEMAVSISGTKPYMGNSLTLIASFAKSTQLAQRFADYVAPTYLCRKKMM